MYYISPPHEFTRVVVRINGAGIKREGKRINEYLSRSNHKMILASPCEDGKRAAYTRLNVKMMPKAESSSTHGGNHEHVGRDEY